MMQLTISALPRKLCANCGRNMCNTSSLLVILRTHSPRWWKTLTVNHIPVLTGGSGRDELREFYSKRFIPQMPPDTEMTSVSRTIGEDQIVDEMIFKFTHTIPMDWMLPGISPTGKPVEVPLVAIVRFRDNKLAHEHIYWDQASVLVQIGLLDPAKLPVDGIESAKKVLDPSLPANELMQRGGATQPTAKNK
jgi:carboxymethylenebutenolidase